MAVFLAAGCASFQPVPIEQVRFKQRAETQERDGLRVTVAVLSREESKQVFGLDLAEKKIQPVWVEIDNGTDVPFVLMLHGLDPNYFSAHEAAYRSHFTLRSGTNRRIDRHFDALGIAGRIAPHGQREGFAFTNLKLGTKEVRIRLFGPGRVEEFSFFLAVPGFKADYRQVDFEGLYAPEEIVDLEDEKALRAALAELPCCTSGHLGLGEGDPLNLVLIGSGEEVHQALIRAGWDETEVLSFGSAWRTFKAFFGGEYKYSPMSALYVYGRAQDAGFQKARDTIHERNHLRLWLSPLRYRGQNVWIGTITRDIGVYFTTKAWNLTTHAIDPDVDEARTYLAEDLATAGTVERFGFVRGVGAASPEQPHRNLMNAPWWSDGVRLVLELSDQPLALDQVGFLYWDWGGVENPEEVNEQLRSLRGD
jgi:LssY C-terminus